MSEEFVLNTVYENILDLSSITINSSQECGTLGFRLSDETQADFIEVSSDGQVTVKNVSDSSLVGHHVVGFETFLLDYDLTGLYALPLGIELPVIFTAASEFQKDPPVLVSPEDPVFKAFFGEVKSYTIEF